MSTHDIKPMAFVDLKAQQRVLGDRLKQAIERVLDHGVFIMGPEIAELEKRLADFVGVKHAVTCSSGTDALLMPLMAWGIGPGDAVFTTPFTFIATAEVIALLGAVPVFVDVDPDTFNLDPELLARAVEAVKKADPQIYPLPRAATEGALRPRAVIPVDLFGLPADYASIHKTALHFGMDVLEDAAQSFGAMDAGGKRAGALAPCAATSFFPAKPLGCYGDGGAVLTDDDDLAEVVRSLRVHGKGGHKYDNVRIGINGRLDTIQAAILLAKMDVFSEELAAREAVAARYTEGLNGWVKTPKVPAGCRSAWAQYTIVADHRDKIQATLKEREIPTAIYYPKPLHRQKAFASLGYKPGDFPVAESLSEHVLSLPMHPYLQPDQIDYVIDAVRAALA